MPRKRFAMAAVAGLALLLAIGGGFVAIVTVNSGDSHDHRPDVVGLFGGEDGFATVAQPSKAEAFRVSPKPGTTRDDYWDIADYSDVSGPTTLPPEAVTALSTILTSPDSYHWHEGGVKACATLYAVRLAFHQGPKQVDVYLCFGCNDLAVVKDGKQKGKDFTSIRPALVKAVKQMFPTDPEIQKLGEQR
jgi:hypothetical protein